MALSILAFCKLDLYPSIAPGLLRMSLQQFSSESELLDGEQWDDSPIHDAHITPKDATIDEPIESSTFAKPNYAGVRKYVTHVLEELRQDYPGSTDIDLRAIATRRWHEMTETERKRKLFLVF